MEPGKLEVIPANATSQDYLDRGIVPPGWTVTHLQDPPVDQVLADASLVMTELVRHRFRGTVAGQEVAAAEERLRVMIGARFGWVQHDCGGWTHPARGDKFCVGCGERLTEGG